MDRRSLIISALGASAGWTQNQSKAADRKYTTAQVAEEVKAITVEQLGVDSDKVKESSDLIQELGADSLDVVELVISIEAKFVIDIPDKECKASLTVGRLISLVTELLREEKRLTDTKAVR